ncbi:MAG: TldD/PmbA family protein [Candidatus Eisenbacteria sp.]|nr:TldD/PmbA family protein [Candidatus Eisenbacteria bacterium]
MFEGLKQRFHDVLPASGFCSLRAEHERTEMIRVRQNVLQPIQTSEDEGAMVTRIVGAGLGYAAASDLSTEGLRRGVERAGYWAEATARKSVFDFSRVAMPHPRGEYETPVAKAWDSMSLAEKIAMATRECERLKTDDRIADFEAGIWYARTTTLYLTNAGGEARRVTHRVYPFLRVTASEGTASQTRSLGALGICRQGGLEILDGAGFMTDGPQLTEEALALLKAPNCPSGKMDLLLEADQMHLQIHESIGHPLELDRILGDERNYAGTSFVKPEYFGSFRYGSEHLNIVFDPTDTQAFASYDFDDDGAKAEKLYLIEKGILKRALGSTISQARSGIPGVANSRADTWRRPPIDRMANVNLEPGNASMEELIGAVERGVYMRANNSWSIDDSRNKFQFGCEYGRLIENGKLVGVVKNPNYRGVSQTFWNNLKMVGDASTVQRMGAINCGKGEPNQVMRVGHVTPTALFTEVDVFGGE